MTGIFNSTVGFEPFFFLIWNRSSIVNGSKLIFTVHFSEFIDLPDHISGVYPQWLCSTIAQPVSEHVLSRSVFSAKIMIIIRPVNWHALWMQRLAFSLQIRLTQFFYVLLMVESTRQSNSKREKAHLALWRQVGGKYSIYPYYLSFIRP